MKAIEINGQIIIYNNLPTSWNGTKHYVSGFNYLTDSELELEGFYDVVIPEHNNDIQQLSDIYFDENNNVYTYNVIDSTWEETLSELKSDKIKHLNRMIHSLLKETDWYVVRKLEKNIDIPAEIISLRDSIRDNANTIESEINALSTKKSVVSYNIIL